MHIKGVVKVGVKLGSQVPLEQRLSFDTHLLSTKSYNQGVKTPGAIISRDIISIDLSGVSFIRMTYALFSYNIASCHSVQHLPSAPKFIFFEILGIRTSVSDCFSLPVP